MWGLNDREEPFDRRLFVLQFLRKIWILVVLCILGAVLGGSLYFVKNVKDNSGVQYSATEVFYVEYAKKPNGEIYYAYNDAGWSYVIMFDEVLDIVSRNLDASFTREELQSMLSTENKADYKILSVTATCQEKELCKKLLDAVVPAMETYAKNSPHMDEISLAMSPTEAKPVIVTYYTERAAVFGAIVAGIVCVFGMAIAFLLDDRFLVPTALEKEYKLPVLGTTFHDGSIFDNGELLENLNYLTKGKKICNLTLEETIICEQLRECDGVVLEINADTDGSKKIEKLILHLRKQDIPIIGMLFCNADEKLVRRYYR